MQRLVAVVLLVSVSVAVWSPRAGAAEPVPAYVPDQVVIQYREGATEAEQRAARGRVGAAQQAVVRAQASGAASLEVAGLPAGANVFAAIATLQSDPAVRFAEPNWLYSYEPTLYATDTYYQEDHHWGVYGDVRFQDDGCVGNCINHYGSQANAAWYDGQTGSTGVYVGVIDTGIQDTHEDLAGNVWVNPFDPDDGRDNDGNGYADDIHGWNFAANNNQTYVATDDENHGTHVSGTIGAVGGNGKGVAGVNWQVTLISGKFFGSGPYNATLEAATRAVYYFTDLKAKHGLNIVATSNSWGCYCYSQALYEAIRDAGQRGGILFVAAAGNDRMNNDTRRAFYPASYDLGNVISVAAIDEWGSLASFSNYGSRSVDLGAPGVGIASTVQGNGYAYYSGTSMATPHVAGATALYAAHTGATGLAIKDAILRTAHPTASLARKTVTGGRLDISCLLATTTCDATGP